MGMRKTRKSFLYDLKLPCIFHCCIFGISQSPIDLSFGINNLCYLYIRATKKGLKVLGKRRERNLQYKFHVLENIVQ